MYVRVLSGGRSVGNHCSKALIQRKHLCPDELLTGTTPGLRFESGPRRRVFTPVGCHTWRTTGITIYLENDGRLEHAPQMAGNEVSANGQAI
jgi:hypothetical protein